MLVANAMELFPGQIYWSFDSNMILERFGGPPSGSGEQLTFISRWREGKLLTDPGGSKLSFNLSMVGEKDYAHFLDNPMERFYRPASPARGIEEEICGFNLGIYV